MSLLCLPKVAPSWAMLRTPLLSRYLITLQSRPPMKREPTLLVSKHTPEVVRTPEDFLKAIGRASETKLSAETWTKFWNMDGSSMRAAGVAVRDRKYILWCMEKFRLGFPIREFAHDAPPKKTVRGWGPKVQDGKRIRSRRLKNK